MKHMTPTFFRRAAILAALALLALTGCRTTHENSTPMPVMTPPPPLSEQDPSTNPGSLFSEAEADYLFSDNRARRVGDIVLVNVVENSTGQNKANTDTTRESSMGLTVENMFGASQFPGGGQIGSTPLLKASTAFSHKGDGDTKRESYVTATVAARVVQTLPGGTMQIEGARQIRVNDETQILVVRGLVRPRDIQPDNSVYSTHLADAQIDFYGEGIVAEKQKPGWLARILDNIIPF